MCCAVALENIRILEEDGLVERTREQTGPYLAEALAPLADHPLVGEVRSLGLVAGVELVRDKAARSHFEDVGKAGTICRDHCLAGGAVLRAVRDVMVMAPALTITTDEIDTLVGILRGALDRTAEDLGIA